MNNRRAQRTMAEANDRKDDFNMHREEEKWIAADWIALALRS